MNIAPNKGSQKESMRAITKNCTEEVKGVIWPSGFLPYERSTKILIIWFENMRTWKNM